MKKIIILMLILLMQLLSAQTLKKVSILLDWKYQFEFAGYIAAKEKGFYQKYGLDVKIVEYNHNDIVKEFDTIVLGEIPIEPAIREGGDIGKPVVYHQPNSQSAKRYQEAAKKLWEVIEKINAEGGVDNEAIQPTTPSGVSACGTRY